MKMIIRIFILLFMALNVNMAFAVTEFVTTCNKSGEDFNLISEWEDCMDLAGDLTDGKIKTGDWDGQVGVNISSGAAVTWDGGISGGTLIYMTGTQYLLDEVTGTLEDDDVVLSGGNSFVVNGVPDSVIITLECYDDDGDLNENGIYIDGFTTSATNYCKITVPVGDRHDGTEGSGFRIDPSLSGVVIGINDDYLVIEWIELTGWNYDSGLDVAVGNNGVVIRNNLFYSPDTERVGAHVRGSCKVYNNIFYGGCGLVMDGAVFCYNNTVYGYSGLGIKRNSGSAIVKNCLSYNNSTDFSASFDITSDYNFSKDDTAPEAAGHSIWGDTDGKTPNFVSVGGGTEDFHLQATSDAIDLGSDLGTEANIDIDNRDRDAEGDTWDIGADEYVGAGGGGGESSPHIYIFSSVRSCAVSGGGGLDSVIAGNGDNIIAENGDNLVAN